MNCDQVRQLLPFARPWANELDAAAGDALSAHLADCPACGESVRRQQAFDARVARTMRDVPIPGGLRERLLVRLGNERSAFYRRWVFRSAAAAAALVLAFYLGSTLFQRSQGPDLLNPRDLVEHVTPPRSFSPAAIDGWLRQYNVQMPAELRDGWDFQYVTAAYATPYRGRLVPTLEFRKGEALAVVLVLRRSQCDPSSLNALDQPQYRSRVLGKSEPGDYIALVVDKQGQHEVFRKPSRITA